MNWHSKKLADVCELVKGKRPQSFVGKSTQPYLTARVVRKLDTPKFVAANCSSSIFVKKKDIIIIMDGSNSGEMFTDLEGVLASTMGIVNFSKNLLHPQYIFQFLVTNRDIFRKTTTGTAIPHLNKEKFGNLEIPIPPLAQQKHLIEKLAGTLSEIARAKDNIEKNLRNTQELFTGYLQQILVNRREDWQTKKLTEVCQIYQPQTIAKRKLSATGKYAVFGANGIIGRYHKYNHELPQLLITCRGATCGSVNISLPKSWITGNAMVIRPIDKQLSMHFLGYIFRGGIDFSKIISGTAQPQITRTNLESVAISYPPLPQQKAIVAKLDSLVSKTKLLKANYQCTLKHLAELRKSISRRAFSGRF